jgi:hypothetical protein
LIGKLITYPILLIPVLLGVTYGRTELGPHIILLIYYRALILPEIFAETNCDNSAAITTHKHYTVLSSVFIEYILSDLIVD